MKPSVGAGGGRRIAPQPQWIVDSDSDERQGHQHNENVPARSVMEDVFSSRRHLNLHAYDPSTRRTGFVEVKIGGHPLDHKRIVSLHAPRPRGPLKAAHASASTRQSKSFEAQNKAVLVYSPVKIGGHALDHVRFVDRGIPSRPLWGHEAPRIKLQLRLPPPAASGSIHPQLIEGVHRGLGNLYDCSHCLRMRQSPRIQLCCGHAVCASCIASDTIRHVIEPRSALCLLECVQCDDYVAMDVVVFPPNRVITIQRNADALWSLKQVVHNSSAWNWKSGTAVAALAVAIGRLLLNPSTPITTPSAATASATTLLEAVTTDSSIADGAARWRKRVAALQPPSKLLRYAFVRTLGVGNFAEVMLVRDRRGRLCVLKESDKLPEAVNEIHLLSTIRHPHVVRVSDYFVEAIGHRHFAYIEMEYCDKGDLLQWLRAHGAVHSAASFRAIFHQLCLGLAEIHRHGIVHRDLKPGNVLLTSEGMVKVADFGVSTRLDSELLTHHAAGTLAFMAPEVRRFFLGEAVSYGTRADVWSLGALAVAMLSGDPEPRVATRPADEVVDELVAVNAFAQPFASMLRQMLDDNPLRRPTLEELMDMVPMVNARL